jgi:hypothetical protein
VVLGRFPDARPRGGSGLPDRARRAGRALACRARGPDKESHGGARPARPIRRDA